MKTRRCALAGMFYPRDPSHLGQLLAGFFSKTGTGEKALGVVSPHAGYIYSGQIAAHAFSNISPDFSGTFIVIGPSHHGYLTSVSSIPWETPLGIVDVDTEFIEVLDIVIDEPSQNEEHSIEVQMPFIKYRFPRSSVVPIMMGAQDPAHVAAVAEKIVAAYRLTKRDIRLIASSDFSHYVPEAQAKDGDLYAIESLTRLDINEFYRRIREKRVTACGYGPISVMVSVCKSMGAREGRLIRYGTSGDVTGDRNEVVGYAAFAVI
ncbi:MAG: AmmeMemoRadiSam system protein B [Methanoregula sp.]|uniref:AmmeMemoRadiSam system protein B n=1 Tax=Methanoregula sp. TaxID=2052170 RepID=UPI003BB070E3